MVEETPHIAPNLELRRRVLTRAGARSGEVEELLTYNRSAIEQRGLPAFPTFPLSDEPHLEAWRAYAEEAPRHGAWAVLRDRIPQLRFPVAAGMSERGEYRDATRKGISPQENDPEACLRLAEPDGVELLLHPAIAGTVPIVAVTVRADFVSLVQALCHRNEPKQIPDSMGACIVAGFNNWDRVRTYRRRWQASHPAADDDAWAQEFSRMLPNKSAYQDRFIILSRGPYSNVQGAEVGFGEAEWLERSFFIRREHECTHYFTLRVFGALQHNLLEELIADFVGLVTAFGSFRTELALRFLGLDSFPTVRPTGRLQNYRGSPPLSEGAFAVLARLAYDGVRNLGLCAADRPQTLNSPVDLARLVCALTTLTMEEVAADGVVNRVDSRLAMIFRKSQHSFPEGRDGSVAAASSPKVGNGKP
ncbi:MAG: hypothetical protein LAO05_02480 [Acidobacteriia bacterium]|nr:hypothetical protein [Terriglobia bacterium]